MRETADMEVMRDNNKRELHIYNSSFSRYFLVDAEKLLLKKAQFRDESGESINFSVDIADWKSISDMSIPSDITLEIPQEGISISLEILSGRVNTDVPDSLFTAIVPEDYSVDSL